MYHYSLIISTSEDKYKTVDEILGIKSNYQEAGWGLQLTEKEVAHTLFIDNFLSILSEKYQQLEGIGIVRNDISIWMLYEYDGQCNMEFSPIDMYKIGNEGITLCVSCWER